MKKKGYNKKIKMLPIIIFLLLSVCVAALLFSLLGKDSESAPDSTTQNNTQIKIACVGDSVTYGYGIENRKEDTYPAVLQNMLGSDYKVRNFGVSGHCVQETSDRPYANTKTYAKSLKYDADIVVFMLGSNDTKVFNWQGIDTFRAAYCDLLDAYGDAKIVLCTPPTAYYIDELGDVATHDDDGITTFEIQPGAVEEIANMVYEVAEERGYPVVDINTVTEGHNEWFAVDGTHPNEDGARAIAQAVYRVLAEIE